MNSKEWIKDRGIQQERTQTKKRKYKTLEINDVRKTTNNKWRDRRNLLNY